MNPKSEETVTEVWRKRRRGIHAYLLAASLCIRCLVARDTFEPVALGSVEVGGEIGRRIDITAHNNLLALDVDKDFIQPFQAKTHLGKGYNDYVGLGKLIDASVRFAAGSRDKKLVEFKTHLIATIIATQEADGYIGIMVKDSRMWRLWDIHEMGYIIMGLASDYRYFGEERSLKAAKRLADYILARWASMPAGWEKFGAIGLENNLLALYQETHDRRYLDFCTQQRALSSWALDLVKSRSPLIKGQAYTDLDLCLAQVGLYHLGADEQLLKSSRDAIRFLTAQDGMTVTGSTGIWEMWTNDQDGRGALGETCATAYEIRLFDAFLRLAGDSRYGDIMERIIYNSLFAAQSPDGRKLRYFTPFEGKREYYAKDTYCCPNNFRRIVADLPTFIYYRAPTGVIVNLFTPSSATIPLEGAATVRIQQKTNYPSDGKIDFQVDPSEPSTFSLQLRIPSWCGQATLTVNEQPWEKPVLAGKFLVIERRWTTSDRLTLDLKMPFRFVFGRKRQSGRVTVMRGPLIFGLNPAQNATLQSKDAADLTGFMIDPSSIALLANDAMSRPQGLACTVRAGDRSLQFSSLRGLQLKLSEFPDPNVEVIYFRLPDLSVGVPDELLSGAAE